MENTEFRKTVAHADGDGGVVYETRQDVSGIIEQNRKEFSLRRLYLLGNQAR